MSNREYNEMLYASLLMQLVRCESTGQYRDADMIRERINDIGVDIDRVLLEGVR